MEDNFQDYSKELLLDPKPGTAAAAARDFGVDLTLTIQNLRLTAEERVRRLDNFIEDVKILRNAPIVVHSHERD
ncbi:MAG TPA: hypothetical protein VN920_01085 [Pyrinomonadaceae bacterium]|nr:hypothetical protein [Pyrinomonadaceae bacterium]